MRLPASKKRSGRRGDEERETVVMEGKKGREGGVFVCVGRQVDNVQTTTSIFFFSSIYKSA